MYAYLFIDKVKPLTGTARYSYFNPIQKISSSSNLFYGRIMRIQLKKEVHVLSKKQLFQQTMNLS